MLWILRETAACLYRFDTYPERTKRSEGYAMAYATFLGFLLSLASTGSLYLQLAPVTRRGVEWAEKAFPSITLKDGLAVSPAVGPTTLTPPDNIGGRIYVDTARTQPLDRAEMDKNDWGIAITKQSLYLRLRDRVDEYTFTAVRGATVVIDSGFFRSVGRFVSYVIYPVFFLFCLGAFTFWNFVAAFLYSVIGILISAATGKGLSYGTISKLALYAQTPVILLQTALFFVPATLAPVRTFVIGTMIVGAYIGLAMRHYQEQDHEV